MSLLTRFKNTFYTNYNRFNSESFISDEESTRIIVARVASDDISLFRGRYITQKQVDTRRANLALHNFNYSSAR